ncbi:uncharacterized protein LOC144654268 isoform X2 [Oculina patagonica]
MFTSEVFFVICFILCLKKTQQTVINPSNLNQYGRNVCTRQTTQIESYYTVTATTSYTYTTTSCGWWGWSRCGSSRPRTVYRNVQRTRSVSVKVIFCCSGWRKSYSSSRECREAICSQGCHSSHGSCIAPNTCRCSTGWTGNTCVRDIDECATNNGGCDQICTNTPGSYRCGCHMGYTKHGHSCQDIDECQTLVPSPCSCGVPGQPCGASCTNTVPNYLCTCAKGFQLRSGGTFCDDINECATANGGCPQICHNLPGKFLCRCFSGYRLISHSNGTTHCEDIDECQSSNGFCTHTCVNTEGSYRCECPVGFFLDSNGRSCSDHNECLLSHHGCQHECKNFLGSYFCSCRSGYALNNDNKTCSDVNECDPVYVASLNKTIIPAGCDQLCHNTLGNYTCSCNQGFQLLYDGQRCRDINECKTGAHSCGHKCHNTPGSYGCSCFHGYKLRADLRTCEGLPCEAIMAPPHGRMNCSGLVTNETCWFTCEDGYDIQGSENRTCLNSSEWSGQQASCNVKSCGTLYPPEKGKVLLPCYTTFGSTCTRDCEDGYVALGDNLATCRLINSSNVAWDIGNFTCEEIILCKPNPCRHGGKCIIINSRKFSCDCQHTGYEGDLCEIGVVMPPNFPKLMTGYPSDNLTLLARPDNSLTVQFNPTMNLTFEPKELVIQYPTSKADFQVTGHTPGVGMVAYDLTGVDMHSFASPKNSSVFIGHNTSKQESVYTRLGLLAGELPKGCQKKKLDNFPCDVTVAFESTSTVSHDVRIESGPVHIITSDNKNIPLSVEGYDFSSPLQARQTEMLKRLISHTKVMEQSLPDNSRQMTQGCSPFHQTAETLNEFIQKDALPKSFLRYFTGQVPLWLKLMTGEESDIFAIENTLAHLVQTTGKRYIHPICKFPSTDSNSAVVMYHPIVNFSISVQNEQLSLSSKGCCFANDICKGGAFLSLSEEAGKEISTMPFMKEMADGGWKLLLSSLRFTTRRKYSTIMNRIPVGPWAEHFSDYHYNMWWQGSADILLKNSSDFLVNMKLTGEAFAFAEDLDSLFTSYFSQPLKCIFHGSVEFNITVRALGQKFSLTFTANDVIGKTILGGTPLLASNCRVAQGLVFTLDRSCKPFENSLLSTVVQTYGGSKYLQIYHSITGGENIAAHDPKNNLRSLEWQTKEIKRVLLDVQQYVPELQPSTQMWSAKVEEMHTNVINARRLLSSSSDVLQLKVLVAEIDDDLDTISRVFDLLVAQLQPYRNRTSIETAINSFIRLKKDLPKTISLSFSKSSIHQNFLGVRFTLTGQVCHKRLCFKNMKCSVWALRDNSCVTNSSRQEAGVIVEGTALKDIFLGNVITYQAGRPLRMAISRNSEPFTTTFESLVNLLGMTRTTTIRMIGHELFFAITGPMFGQFEAVLNVTADVENVVDWKSVVFEVEGSMNKSSHLYTMLESMIANETALAAMEATKRLSKAQATYNDAKIKADAAKEVLKLKQAAVEELRIEKERAAEELRVARLQYHLAKVRFNNTVYFRKNIQNFVCEIRECNYTCFNGCVIPDLCQDPINITYLERYCDTVDKPITIQVVQKSTETRSFEVATFQTVYTGNCRSGVPLKKIFKYAKTGFKIGKFVGGLVGGFFGPVGKLVGKVVGGIAGGVLGGVVGYFSKKIFGCSNTYERVPAEPRLVEYEHKVYEAKAIEKIIKEVRCTGQEEKTKPGGYGPPYPCCKKYGCQTKVLDPRCVINNQECLVAMTELKFTLDAMNETFQSAYLSLRNSVDDVKKATSVYEKARIRHEFAVSILNKVKSHTEQRQSAVEIVNASMLHVRRMVGFGLKIAQAINASKSDNKKAVDVGDMNFALSMVSEDTKKIIFQTDVSSGNGQKKAVSFLVDFDQVERSVSSASKIILTKLFGNKNSKKKRSTPEDNNNQANSTHSLHSSFTDYPYACLFANTTHLYLSSIFQSLENLILSVKGLNANLSSGFHDLETLADRVHLSSMTSSNSSVNNTSANQNSSFVTEYIEMIEVLKNESTKLTNDSSQSWNDTLEAWRAFLEVFTSNNGFEECSGTQDCIDYFFEGEREFYEFEDSPRALVIKDALPQLREVVTSLTTAALTMVETEQALHRAVSLLKKTRDESVLCGGKPVITSSSQKEVILLKGYSLLLSCTAKSEAGLKYVWKRNDKLIKESPHGTFYERAVSKRHEGAYVCVVSNNKGSTISNVTIVKVHSKPSITQHPQRQRVVLGSQMPATFICNATGQPTPSFQWFFQSTNSSVFRVNETKPVLYMTNPRRHQEGYYYCEVSNMHGAAVSQKARLDVLGYTIGLPRLLIALNLTSRCWLTTNSSNSSTVQDPLPCDNDSIAELPSSINENMTGDIVHSLASSLNVSVELISDFDYDSRNTSTATVAFIIDIDKEPWKEDNFTSYIEIVETLADVKTNLLEKLERFNSDILNKTFKVPWNTTTLIGEPGSLIVYPLSPECPEGQALSENGYICANCPAGLSYSSENDTCIECPPGTYQPLQGQTECIPCGTNLTTAFNGTVEEAECIANCPAGSHSTVNRTCYPCPVGTYQPSDGEKDCLPCGQGLTTTLTGAVNRSQCIKIEPPPTDIPATKEQSTVTTKSSATSESVTEEPPTKNAGKRDEQETAEESPWKLPVFIVVPSIVVLILLALLVAFCTKKRRAKDTKPTAESAVTSHENPTYDCSEFPPEKNVEDNVYEPSPSACGKDQTDLPEQFYDNIGYATSKDLKEKFADDAIYDYVEPPQGEKYELGFTNPYYTSSDS